MYHKKLVKKQTKIHNCNEKKVYIFILNLKSIFFTFLVRIFFLIKLRRNRKDCDAAKQTRATCDKTDNKLTELN